MNDISFSIPEFHHLAALIGESDWDNNDVDVIIRKEKGVWVVCLKERVKVPIKKESE